MIRLTYHVELADGAVYDGETGLVDIVAMERHYAISAAQLGDRIEFGVFVVWHALKQSGRTALEFDPFLAALRDLKIDDALARPTSPGRSDETSSRSRSTPASRTSTSSPRRPKR